MWLIRKIVELSGEDKVGSHAIQQGNRRRWSDTGGGARGRRRLVHAHWLAPGAATGRVNPRRAHPDPGAVTR